MFSLSIKNLKELQYDNILVLLYCSIEHLSVKVTKFSFIIWVAIAETLRLLLKEITVYGNSDLFFFNRQSNSWPFISDNTRKNSCN